MAQTGEVYALGAWTRVLSPRSSWMLTWASRGDYPTTERLGIQATEQGEDIELQNVAVKVVEISLVGLYANPSVHRKALRRLIQKLERMMH